MVELLYFDGCPSYVTYEPRLRELVDRWRPGADITLRSIESVEAAERESFLGSPSIRVNGRDVEPGAESRDDFGLKCRLYRYDDEACGVPSDEWVIAALTR